MDFAMLLGGGVLLYFGAEWLVAGAAGLARSLGVQALVVGLTVVAYGTSMPEVVVGVDAALAGRGAIALGNVIGSNIANFGLILGITALVKPPRVAGTLRRRELPVMIACTLVLPLLLVGSEVPRYAGALLLGAAVVYTSWMVRSTRGEVREARKAAAITAEAADAAGAPSTRVRRGRLGLFVLAGLVGLVLGGRLLVSGAVGLSLAFGISERVVGLTIVAAGTSLPELATSLVAALRGHSDIAVGNVIGSNIFNVLLCLGAASVAGSVGAPLADLALDLGVLVALTLLGAVFLRSERTLTRVEGAMLLMGYVGFLVALVVGG